MTELINLDVAALGTEAWGIWVIQACFLELVSDRHHLHAVSYASQRAQTGIFIALYFASI